MALDYSIVLDTEMSPLEATQWVVDKIPTMSLEEDDKGLWAICDGMTCYGILVSKLGEELGQESFGINTTVNLRCRLEKFDRYEAGIENLVNLCVTILANLSCDMAVWEDEEDSLVLRKDGQVFVNLQDREWRSLWEPDAKLAGIEWVEKALPMR